MAFHGRRVADRLIVCVTALLLLAFAPVEAAEQADAETPASLEGGVSPLRAFLLAADNGDMVGMSSWITTKRGVSARELTKKLEGCYLRRVYSTPDNTVLAAWMCSEKGDSSRVLIAELTGSKSDVSVVIAREDRNKIPAPPRQGSALAE